ncbi:hypothetical protein K6W16_05135 [Burkholderia dolosa]|uniref:Uncharacterized protein n=1 Tax=Burkholderia dolosa TaxID=152500 RepID=A0A892I4B6_9BURK|nr:MULTISPECIES: hypothetical protein [Burkholderia]AJY13454.1 hypothetical protein AK34_2242 [Burkholderia dolosa AU0158]MBR8417811.1 hypothetical protein [Burkholderia dolosa]MBY4656344.1 hypothetical protein [Burkholderia dolosa]MBY4687747.1 hypothetical protein [Burkholderia dolosa]MBY4782033.1 hypothetical protein [Burkholderia dolosa]
MTRIPSRGNKTPPRNKHALALPKLGTALNWVAPKLEPVTKARASTRKRTPASPQ